MADLDSGRRPQAGHLLFRGADVETYIRARAQTEDDHRHKLETNYRSQPGLVAAVNALFKHPVALGQATSIFFAQSQVSQRQAFF